MMFFLLPAWGLSNSAATLVGQNLGAKQLQRAEESVMKTIYYNVIFMAVVTVLFWVLGNYFVSFFTTDEAIRKVAAQAGRIIASGYIFYGIGMVMMNTFNGAGDTWTPTIINFCGFWLIQIPLAYILAKYFAWGPLGVFIAIPVAETAITLAGYFYFKKGKWKTIKV
jgi:Na+-driven multidrug efflux pump